MAKNLSCNEVSFNQLYIRPSEETPFTTKSDKIDTPFKRKIPENQTLLDNKSPLRPDNLKKIQVLFNLLEFELCILIVIFY